MEWDCSLAFGGCLIPKARLVCLVQMGEGAIGMRWFNTKLLGPFVSLVAACGEPSPEVVADAGFADGSVPVLLECPEHTHVLAGRCVPCAPGWTNASGDEIGLGDTRCDPVYCGRNERVVGHRCQPCGPGTRNLPGDLAAGGDTECDAEACASDQYVENHECRSCPRGTFRAAGDDVSGPNTRCERVFCGEDEYVLRHRCVPCEVGTYRVPGDDASLDDTRCEPQICGEDETVQGHRCTPCPPGTRQPAGLQSDGEDVACTEVFCRPEHFVSDHHCVPCPEGQNYPHRASAAGPDTECLDLCTGGFGTTCDRLLVGEFTATGDDFSAVEFHDQVLVFSDEERVHVHRFVDGGWVPEAVLNSASPDGDGFGASLALDGDLLFVGAPLDDGGLELGLLGPEDSGAVYGFRRTERGAWVREQYLKAATPTASARLGSMIGLNARTLLVVERSFGLWDRHALSDRSSYVRFRPPWHVTGEGEHLLLRSSGSFQVWETDGSERIRSHSFHGRGGAALAGDVLVVANVYDRHPVPGPQETLEGEQTWDANDSGMVRVRTLEEGEWSSAAVIKAQVVRARDRFGSSVAMRGSTLAVSSRSRIEIYEHDEDVVGAAAWSYRGAIDDFGTVLVDGNLVLVWRDGEIRIYQLPPV